MGPADAQKDEYKRGFQDGFFVGAGVKRLIEEVMNNSHALSAFKIIQLPLTSILANPSSPIVQKSLEILVQKFL